MLPEARAFLAGLPLRRKAELHLHLEGAVSAPTLVLLSRRTGLRLFPDAAALRARRHPGDPGAFLALYRDVCRLLREPADYALLARDLVRRLSRERIVYAEVYVSPAIVERIGLPWLPVRDVLERELAAWERRTGSRVRVLLDSVRHWGPEAAHRVLDLHRAHPWPRAVGFGLGGDEAALPARAFRDVYRRLPRLGLAGLVHAGEWCGPGSVAESLEELRPARIAHGIRAGEDPGLVRLLARRGIPLDVCPVSNLATGAVRGRHPTLALLRAGVRISLSTDDPSLFGTTLRREFATLAREGATAAEMRHLLAAAFSGALAAHGTGTPRTSARTRS